MSISANTLSKLIIASAQCHNDSYDKAASDAASIQADADRAADPNNIYAGMVDYSTFYRLTRREACYKVCTEAGEPKLAEPVYLMLSSWWNDSLDWAEAVEKNNTEYFTQNMDHKHGSSGQPLENINVE